jgi:indole-3-glycerol phosphate synthase
VAGADAVLLIADILLAEELKKLHAIATGVGLDCLVEVHKEEDLGKVLAAGADIIGINNRDLHTFRIDPSVTQRLIRLIPPGKTIVSESGIKTYEDVMFLKSIGVNAVLIGEAFMEAEDIGLKMRQVMRY